MDEEGETDGASVTTSSHGECAISRDASTEGHAAAERSRIAFARLRTAAGEGHPTDLDAVVVPADASQLVFAEASLSANTIRA